MKYQSRDSVLRIIRKEMPFLHQRFGVEHLALFGSFARNDATPESDIDIVVTLSRPLGFEFIQLADYLEGKLGRKVDLITDSTLKLEVTNPRKAHIVKDIRDTLIHVQ